jgi:hypothetical protein
MFCKVYHTFEAISITCELGSSFSIVSGYGLNDGCSIPGRGERIFPASFVTRPALLPSSLLYNGYRGSFPGLKRGQCVTLTTHRHLVPTSKMSMSYISSPPKTCCGTALAF